MLGIIIRTQFEGTHCYPNAPEKVKFLRNPHRHIFHVEAEIETFNYDRELEFILVKHEIESYINKSSNLGSASCETIAQEIRLFIKERYPKPNELKISNGDTRKVNVKVFEDNENGAFVREF